MDYDDPCVSEAAVFPSADGNLLLEEGTAITAAMTAREARLTPIHERDFAAIERVTRVRLPAMDGFTGSFGNAFSRYWVRNRVRQRLALGESPAGIATLVDEEHETRPRDWEAREPRFYGYYPLPSALLGQFALIAGTVRHHTYAFSGRFERGDNGYLRWRVIPATG